MTVLTLEELAKLNPERIPKFTFLMNIELWKKIDTKLKDILSRPLKIKFDENIRNYLTKKRGIYMFIIEPEFPFSPRIDYLIYIGRVIGTNNFKNRFQHYVKAIGNKNVKRNIQLLTNLWPEKTYVYTFELNKSDDEIKEIEKQLVNYIIPPLNNQFSISEAVNSRSLYN